MSGTGTTKAGTPLSTLVPAAPPAAVADTDTVFMLVYQPTSQSFVPLMIPRATVLASALPLAGGVAMTGMFLLAGAPTEPLHPATMAYVDDTFEAALQQLSGYVSSAQAAETGAATAATSAISALIGKPGGAAALDPSGTLLLNGQPALSINAQGQQVCPASIPDTNDGFVPVAGSRVEYLDGGIRKVAV